MLLSFIVAGLTTGSVYGLAGIGLVLTYKASGVFNFAHGALATVAAYLFYTLHVQHGLPWPIAAAICVLVLGPVMGIALERVARSLAAATLAVNVAGTIGLLLIIQAAVVLVYGTTENRPVPPYLPTHVFDIGGAAVTADRIIVFGVGILATAALYVWFRYARIGVATRAVVDDPGLVDLSGTDPVAVRRTAWMVGSSFACASGVLLVPFIALDSVTLTFLVVAAFGAAALGAFSSLPITYVGGLVLGVAASLCTKYFDTGLLVGLAPSLPFVVLFLVLLVSPRGRLGDRARIVPRDAHAWSAPWPVQAAGLVALAVVLLLAPNFAGLHLDDWTHFLALTILFLALGLLTRTSGQVSLCHVSFLAIGVCAFSHLSVDHHWPWGLALLAAGTIAVPIGALLAVPAMRLTGLALALATFGFGLLLQTMFYGQSYMFGDVGLGVQVPRPDLPGLDLSVDANYYYFVLAVTTVIVLLVVAVNASRLGRLLRALGDSPVGLATNGTSVNVTRLLVFCLSAFLAAIAGVLDAATIGQVDGDSYQPITSLVYFALIIISFGSAPWYAVFAAAGITLVPSYLTGSDTTYYLQLLFGLVAILYAVLPASLRGVPAPVRSVFDRLSPRRAAHDAGAGATNTAHARVASAELAITDLRVRFGGIVAVDGANLQARTGRITGLIGPNGAGKTTTFNSCSGLNRPTSGTVALDGHDVSRRGSSWRARKGLGRTFQQMELFDSMTVRENVTLGHEAGRAGLNPFSHIAARPGYRKAAREAADAALAQCDLTDLADRPAGALSTGQRRLVELARCLAGPFRILLLDEPSSGLDRAETARFGEILRSVVAERGVGVLLVEHDMALVTEICDDIYVLDFGKPVFDGTPADVMRSPLVRAAYLGETETEVETATPRGPERDVVA